MGGQWTVGRRAVSGRRVGGERSAGGRANFLTARVGVTEIMVHRHAIEM